MEAVSELLFGGGGGGGVRVWAPAAASGAAAAASASSAPASAPGDASLVQVDSDAAMAFADLARILLPLMARKFVDACDLLDRRQLVRIVASDSQRHFYEFVGVRGERYYTSAAFCSCAAFQFHGASGGAQASLGDRICKHQLAFAVAERVHRPVESRDVSEDEFATRVCALLDHTRSAT